MSTHVARRPDESGAFRAHEHAETPPRLRFEEVEAFSRDRMLELLVHLTHDGYSITLFDWLDHVPGDLRGFAVMAFRASMRPPMKFGGKRSRGTAWISRACNGVCERSVRWGGSSGLSRGDALRFDVATY